MTVRTTRREGPSPDAPATTYRFLEAEKANHTVRMICSVFCVSRATYHAWRDPQEAVGVDADALLRVHIRGLHRASRPRERPARHAGDPSLGVPAAPTEHSIATKVCPGQRGAPWRPSSRLMRATLLWLTTTPGLRRAAVIRALP